MPATSLLTKFVKAHAVAAWPRLRALLIIIHVASLPYPYIRIYIYIYYIHNSIYVIGARDYSGSEHTCIDIILRVPGFEINPGHTEYIFNTYGMSSS